MRYRLDEVLDAPGLLYLGSSSLVHSSSTRRYGMGWAAQAVGSNIQHAGGSRRIFRLQLVCHRFSGHHHDAKMRYNTPSLCPRYPDIWFPVYQYGDQDSSSAGGLPPPTIKPRHTADCTWSRPCRAKYFCDPPDDAGTPIRLPASGTSGPRRSRHLPCSGGSPPGLRALDLLSVPAEKRSA